MHKMEQEHVIFKQRFEQNEEETQQMRSDMQSIIGYKNELELLIEEQSINITRGTQRLAAIEETLKRKEGDMDKKDA